MGFLARAFDKRSVTVVPDDLWRHTAAPIASGVNVTMDSAMTFSAVFAAHKILAESVAMLPLFLLKRLERGKAPATNKRLYSILHDVANPEMDAYLVRETMTAHLAGWGNAFAKIDYNADGEIEALWPLPPNRVRISRDRVRELMYEVTLPDGQTKRYRPFEIFHLRGMSPDGVNGYSPIKLARQGIGLALAAEAFGATFFGNGAQPQGVISHPQLLSEKAHDRMINSWNAAHQGVSNSNKIAILEEGARYDKVGIDPDDAQFLETRAFQIAEIARWYRIPSMMLNMDGASSTYASVEAFGLQFIIYTIYPWLVRWEKAISMQLLLERERGRYFAEHLMTAILRGDTQARYTAYGQGRQWGWLSVNDIRELENMNPIDGGDRYLTPSNMVDANEPSKIQRSYLPVLIDAVQRVLRREANDIRMAVQKVLVRRGAEEFAEWLSQFYQEHQDFIVRNLSPVIEGYAAIIANSALIDLTETVAESLRLFALRRAGQVQEQFRSALSEPDPAKAIDRILESWDGPYIERLARMEISRQTALLVAPMKEPTWAN